MAFHRRIAVSAFLALLAAGGCARPGTPDATKPPANATATAVPTPLPAVSPLPSPSTPPFVSEIAPRGTGVGPLAQIRVRFTEPVVPLEALGAPDRAALLSKFTIDPPLPGRFVVLTPRMIAFASDAALPAATRIRVTVKAGLATLSGKALASDLAWTFATAPLVLSDGRDDPPSPAQETPGPLDPRISVRASVAVDRDSLVAHASLRSADGKTTVPLQIAPDSTPAPGTSATPSPEPSAADPFSEPPVTYALVPAQTLAKATTYDVVIAPGVLPARGNLATNRTFHRTLRTYPPLAFTRVTGTGQSTDGPGPGRYAGGTPTLAFTTAIDPKSLDGAIATDPAPIGRGALAAIDDDGNVVLNPDRLRPATAYTITAKPPLRDVFGQALAAAVTTHFTTGDLSADFWAPSGLAIFPSSMNVQLDADAINLPDHAYRLATRILTPADLVTHDSADPGNADRPGLLPDDATWPRLPLRATPNRSATVHLPVREVLHGPSGVLAYGLAARTNSYQLDGKTQLRNALFTGIVNVTDLGIDASWFPGSGVVFVNRLSTGAPVANASVAVYPSYTDDATLPSLVTTCASGTTGADGALRLTGPAFARCAAAAKGGNAPALLAVARLGNDWTFTRTSEWGDFYQYGFDGATGWNAGTPQSRGTIVTDRDLYQPGETLHATAIAYELRNGTLQRVTRPLPIAVVDPDGRETALGTRTPDAYGTFAFDVPIAKNAELGTWIVHATLDKDVTLGTGYRVAHFKAPNFRVDLHLGAPVATAGSTVSATSTSTYLFGAPVQGGRATLTVTRQPTTFAPKGDDAFSFGKRWSWPEEQPEVPTDVLTTTTTLAADGKTSAPIPVANALAYPMTYRADLETTDVSNLAVAASASFTALPSAIMVGVAGDAVGNAGTPMTFRVLAVAPDGKPVPGTRVHVQLDKKTYESATQIVAGSEQARTSVSYATAATADVVSANDPVSVTLTPSSAGAYRVRALVAGAADDSSAGESDVWVGGAGLADWASASPAKLTMALDKPSYRIGETARVLIQSPYPDARLALAVVRDKQFLHVEKDVHGGAPVLTFTVTREMLPNAAVQVLLVRRGAALTSASGAKLWALAKIGVVGFGVDLHDRYLHVGVTPQAARVGPATTTRVALHVSDETNAPVKAQLTAIVANDAVLQLTGYRPPDLVPIVYAQQPLSLRIGDNRRDVVLARASEPVPKGWGFGGGFGPGAGSTRIRTDFRSVALVKTIETDAHGDAQIAVPVPDDLTTWRVLAVARTADARFGNGEGTFIATTPLVTNPVLPRFVRPGDRFEGGATVTNTIGDALGTVNVTASASGPIAILAGASPVPQASASGTVANGATQAFRFPMQALAATGNDATITVKTRAGNSASDAFRLPVAVNDSAITESLIDVGTTTTSTALPLEVAQTLPRDVGGLQLDLASTLLPDVVTASRDAFAQIWPYAEPAASRLTIASALGRLPGSDAATVARERTRALTDLAALQTSDGGFRWYPSAQTADPFVSAYVGTALGEARADGVGVPAAMTARLTRYLNRLFADPGRAGWCGKDPCRSQLRLQILVALRALGAPRTDGIDAIVAHLSPDDTVAQIALARLLLADPATHGRGSGLAATLLRDSVNVRASSASATLRDDAWLNSGVVAQALTLQLALAANAPADDVDRLVRGLLAARANGSWQTTCDDAAALTALVAYARTQPADARFGATATLGGATVAHPQFGPSATHVAARLPMAQLPRGRSSVGLRVDGTGTLHYASTLTYRVADAAPGAFAGLLLTRTVRDAGATPVLTTMGLDPLAGPVALAAGHVYDLTLTLTTDHAIDEVTIVDPLPAGLEAVDTALRTTSDVFTPLVQNWTIDDQQIGIDRVGSYVRHLGPGVYAVHELVRSVTPGQFAWPGATVRLRYSPAEFGRTASATVSIH